METTYMFIGRWTDKENVVHIYNGIYLAIKKNEIIPFAATWMGLEIILLVSEVDQKQPNIMMSYMWIWIMTQMNLSTKQKLLRDMENQHGIAKVGG